MTISRRLMNLAGTLIVLVALIAGTILMALPVYLESIDVNNNEAQVAASNEVLVTRIGGLRAKQAELPAIQQELDGLHAQLPGVPQLDDVTTLALKAAEKSGSAVTSVEFGDLVAFAPRGTDTVLAGLPKTATEVSAESSAADETPLGDNEATDGDTAGDAASTGEGTGSREGSASQIQIAVTIAVNAPDLAASTRFLDELRAGPRLLQIESASVATNEETQETSLIVVGSAFVRLN